MAKIRDVAQEAGVSVGTVSMVLNHPDYGSPAIRQKVQAAVEKVQYVPSEMARNLALNDDGRCYCADRGASLLCRIGGGIGRIFVSSGV